MFSRRKHVWFWVISVIATLFVAYFQRVTGPSYPLKNDEMIGDTRIHYKLPRTAVSGTSLPVIINLEHFDGAVLRFRPLNSPEEWTETAMTHQDNQYSGEIPSQPPAGKVEYQISIQKNGQTFLLPHKSPVIARFRGSVPAWLLILHILFMFASLLLATRCFFAVWESQAFNRKMVWATTITMFIGGLILGPLVQKYAFGQLWTGLPFGTDLTDNKTLFILLLWIVSLFLYKKRKYFLSLTSIMTLIIFLIPHSLLGSELDHRTGQHKNSFSQVSIIGTPELPAHHEQPLIT